MTSDLKKLLANNSASLQKQVAVERLRRAGIELDSDLLRGKDLKVAKKDRLPAGFIKRLARG